MKRILMVVVCLISMIGVSGCMLFNNKEKTKQEMLDYLHEKYNEDFVEEQFEEGSTLFPEMYGGDKMMVRPSSNKNLPFYVFKNVKSEGFNDNYIISNINYRFNEKYRKDIEMLDSREKAVKLKFALLNRPKNPKMLNISVDEFEKDSSYKGDLFLYVAINENQPQSVDSEAEFLFKIYTYMMGKTNRNFEVSVGYINNNFNQAEELIRIAHTINFNWAPLGDNVTRYIHFGRNSNIKDSSYFINLLK